MRCLMRRLTPLLLVLSLPATDLSKCSEEELRLAADSYCSTYMKVIRAKGEGAITAKSEVKKRILANEITFRQLCEAKK